MDLPLSTFKSLELGTIFKFVDAVSALTSGKSNLFSTPEQAKDYLREELDILSWDDLSSTIALLSKILYDSKSGLPTGKKYKITPVSDTQTVWGSMKIEPTDFTPMVTTANQYSSGWRMFTFQKGLSFVVSAKTLMRLIDDSFAGVISGNGVSVKTELLTEGEDLSTLYPSFRSALRDGLLSIEEVA